MSAEPAQGQAKASSGSKEGSGPAEPAGVWGRIRPVLGRAVRGVRQFADRRLHPLRRKAARALLRRRTEAGIERVLILCYGNICRSPYAAGILMRSLDSSGIGVIVEQGGFFGPNRPTTDRALAVAARRGVDLRGHRSRLVTAEDLRQASVVVVMEPAQARQVEKEARGQAGRTLILGDLDPVTPATRSIVDPYGRDEEFFDATYARIERCVTEFVRTIREL